MTSPSPRRLTILIFSISIISSFIILNRWAITDIGVLSYGRIWQLYISYQDFGFIRRAFIGTLLSITGLNSSIENEYVFAIVAHHFSIIILSLIIIFYIINNKIENIPIIITIALSPALIIQSGYTTGSLDIFVLIIASINILLSRNPIIFSALIFIGVFTHELFIFTIPAQLIAYIMRTRGEISNSINSDLHMPLLSILLSVCIVHFLGTSDLSKEFVEATMAEKIPNAAGQHGLWSGYFEISRTASENSLGSISALLRDIGGGIAFLSIPLLYVCVVTIRLHFYSSKFTESMAMVISALFPLLTALVATDLYRWIGMSANMGLLLTLVMLTKEKTNEMKTTYLLLPFSLLAPFGSAQIDWPFPAHQLILERLF